ncbi:hypothetical protein BST85_06750 [Aureitalea marina]|uniref:Uncharacterized protein n=2 Tax=Aureitalea marina TaxID=930804 RepID=A0A2S7KPR9_9FLAO|nr:hypothetical protein BST85_06750 [Aureitalea marina]
MGCKDNAKETQETETVATENKLVDQPSDRMELGGRLIPINDSDAYGKVRISEANGQLTMVAKFVGLDTGTTYNLYVFNRVSNDSKDTGPTGRSWRPNLGIDGDWVVDTSILTEESGMFEVDAKGNGTLEFTSDRLCLDCDDDTKNISGKALIVLKTDYDPTTSASEASCGGVIQ